MVDTMAEARTRRKRTHSAALKAEVLAACAEPGASVAAIALAHALNTNLVHKWRRQAPRAEAAGGPKSADTLPTPRRSEFVALPSPPAIAEIRIELRRGATAMTIGWPLAAAADCGGLAARLVEVIRIEAVWLAVEPLDLAIGMEPPGARGRGVRRGPAAPCVPVHQPPRQPDQGAGARRLRCVAGGATTCTGAASSGPAPEPVALALSREQFDALVLGLPWQRLAKAGVISVL